MTQDAEAVEEELASFDDRADDSAVDPIEETVEPIDASDAGAGIGLRLSAEESAALLDAIRSGAAPIESARSAALGAADEPMRRAHKRADDALPNVEAALRDALVRMGTPPAEVDHEPTSVVTYETLTAGCEPSAAIWTVHAADANTLLGLVVIGTGLATSILERRLGTPDALAGAGWVERPPSSLERRVMEPLALDTVRAAFAPFVVEPATLKLGVFRAKADATSRFAPCLQFPLRITLKTGTISAATVAIFSSVFTMRAPGKSNAGRAQVLETVSAVEVDAIAVLGRCQGTVRGLLALGKGSILRLDGAPERPVDLRVDGVTVLRGMPVVKDGNMAIEVSS